MRLSTMANIKSCGVVMLSVVVGLSASCSREPSTESATTSTKKENIQADTKHPSEPPKKLYPYHPVIGDYLNKIEAELAAENVKIAKKDADDFQYGLSFYNIVIVDLNGDKLDDVILRLYTCEVNSCHNTTGSNEIAVFLNKGSTYELAAAKPLNGYEVEVSVIDEGVILVNSKNFADSDPTCCPSIEVSEKYKLSGKELALVK